MTFDWLGPLKLNRSTRVKRRRRMKPATSIQVEHLQDKVLLSAAGHHSPALDLVNVSDATHTAIASGNWSEPSTWQDGNIPTDGARVVIPQGSAVTVDGVIGNEFKTIRVDGTLNFKTDTNTELRVDTLVSSMSGRVEVGTKAAPIQSDVTARVVFADDGVIDRSWDPTQISRGAILLGSTEIHGANSTHQESLAVHPTAGSTSLELNAAPVGWRVGDEIVITGTQGSTSDEVRTIDAITGTSVTFNQPLEIDHVPPRSDLNVYVANTTRNVEFTSENTELAHRGHIMFAHNLDTHVKNARFTELGRTNKKVALDDINFIPNEDAVGNRTSAWVDFTTEAGPATNVRGRYAVHFHRNGTNPTSAPATIDGSVVVGSPGWGFVNHSSNVNITNNVAYGVHGASFYTEAGDEIGTIENNIAIRTVNPDFQLEDNGEISVDLRAEQQDFGVDGDGFWLSGHLVDFRNNVSAGASGHGIIYWTDGLVEADTGRTSVKVANIDNGHLIPGRETIPTWWAPMADINNNEAFGATIGFRARYIHSSVYLGDPGSSFHEPPPQEYIDTLSPTVDGLTVWGSRDGALLNYNERLSLKNADIVGIGAEYVRQGGTTDLGVGIDMYNEVSRGPGVVENVNVEGFNMGILAPRHGEWTMAEVHLRNTTDMLITKGAQAERSLTMTNITFGDLTGTAVEGNQASRQNIVMDGEGDEDQPYWFLLTNRISLDGQGLFFNEQAGGHVPLAGENQCHFLVQIPDEFVGKTNQELRDQYGTSFGGAITPDDAQTANFLTGGVVATLPPDDATDPPLYDMRLDEAELIDEGTLTNFTPGGEGQGCDDGGDDDDGDDDDGDDDDGDDDDGDDDDGDDDDGDDDDGDDDDGDDDDGDDDDGDDDDGDDDDGDDDDGDDDDGDDDDGDDDDGDDDDGDDDDGDDDDEMLTIELPEGKSVVRIRQEQVLVRVNKEIVSRDDIEGHSALSLLGSDDNDIVILDLRNLGETSIEEVTVDSGDGDDKVVLKAIDGAFEGVVELMGGVGEDELRSKTSVDVMMSGGPDNDRLFGGDGNDEMFGGAGNDRLIGGRGRDMINGGRGADFIRGGDGADEITGGRGADNIDGQAGRDVLIEEGNKNFVLSDTSMRGLGRDRLKSVESAVFLAGPDAALDDELFSGDVEWND